MEAKLLVSDANGIFVPQIWADRYADQFSYVDPVDLQELLNGPESKFYWESWDNVLSNAETKEGGVLYQDGDLWLIYPDAAIDAVNEYVESCVEYEESHEDAGDNYAHLVGGGNLLECWTSQKETHAIEQLYRERFLNDHRPNWEVWGVDPRFKMIERDRLADMMLESFTMVPRHMFESGDDALTLDSFPIGEIEIPLESLEIDELTLDYIRESCECYISGNDSAYVSSDRAWAAVVDIPMLNAHIEQYIEDKESE